MQERSDSMEIGGLVCPSASICQASSMYHYQSSPKTSFRTRRPLQFCHYGKLTFAYSPITHVILLLNSFTAVQAYYPIHFLILVKVINSLLFLFLEINMQKYYVIVNYQSIE